MNHLFKRLRGLVVAIAALALSAGLAFGAQPEGGWGLTNASEHAGKVVPVSAGQQETDEDVDEDLEEDLEEDLDEDLDEDAAGGGENCSTDPRELTEEELAELKHGSIVCWAAHQDEEIWGEEFANHGQWVKSWAQKDKDDEETTEEETSDEDAGALSAGNGRGNGQGNGKGHNK